MATEEFGGFDPLVMILDGLLALFLILCRLIRLCLSQQFQAATLTQPVVHQTNVEFVHILGSVSDPIHEVVIRIFERGVGPTSSSGTGTCAAATAMIGVYSASSEIDVVAPGGMQNVRWSGPGAELFLTGPATLIAEGKAW